MKDKNKNVIWLITLVRIVVGWHLLYEGIAKLFNPTWSAASYLMESKWLFSGFFHWLISDSSILQVVNFLNIAGLLIIGTFLFIGLFTRAASISGAFLLLLYYVANPPFVPSSLASSSNYYIINYNLIEIVVLITIASLPKDYLWSVQRFILTYHAKRKEQKFPASANHEILETSENSRRELIKNLAVVPLLGAVFFGMAKKRGWISFEEKNLAAKPDAMSSATIAFGKDYSISELKGKMPSGKIKDQIGRAHV